MSSWIMSNGMMKLKFLRSNFSNAREALEKKKEKSQPISFQILAILLISHAYSNVD